MLANGATLGYKTQAGSTGSYTVLNGLKEIPDMGVDAEKVENTTLTDAIKHYEMGIGDAGDMVYKFKYDNSGAQSPYRVLKGYEKNNTLLYFEETVADGTKTHFSGYVAVKRTGGGVNSAIDFELAIALNSDFEVVDPTTTA